MGEWGDEVIHHKYDPLPEDGPRYRKKSKKRRTRSDHKHEYETVCIESRYCKRPFYYIGTRCKVCGRLANRVLCRDVHEPPEGMPLYRVEDIYELWNMKVLPDDLEVHG